MMRQPIPWISVDKSEQTIRQKKRIGLFGLVVLLWATSSMCTAQRSDPSVTERGLLEDLNFLAKKMDEVHADPYRMISQQEFESSIRRINQAIKQQAQNRFSLLDSYYVLQEAAALIQDEHTSMVIPNKALERSSDYFPFKIRAVDGRIYIEESLGEAEIPRMAQLLQINGKDAESLRKESQRFLNFPLPHAKDMTFGPAFASLLTAYFDLKAPWEIRYRIGMTEKTIASEGISLETSVRANSIPGQYKSYMIKCGGSEIPVLDIPNFAYGRFEDYRKFVDNFFQENLDKEAIVIDIRRNPGGNGTWGYYLMDHFAKEPYPILERFDFKVSREFKDSGYASKAGDIARRAKNGTYIPIAGGRIHSPEYQGEKFNGKVFLLTSRATNSAGVVAAAIFQNSQMGTIIGQETAGRIEFSSDPIFITLPHSKLRLKVPVAVYALPGADPDRGVAPDVSIRYSIEDLREGRDKEMEYIRKLLCGQSP
jgi:hypothetical protein